MKRILFIFAFLFAISASTITVQATEPQPSYPGGEEALAKYFQEAIVYPKTAIENSIEGTVTVDFDVNTDGTISNVQIVRPIDPDLEEEAVRVVKAMPAWQPAISNGTPVKSTFRLPVKFRLPK